MQEEVVVHTAEAAGTSSHQIQDKEFAGHTIGLGIANGIRKASARIITESCRLKLPKPDPSPRVEDPKLLTGRRHHVIDQVHPVVAKRAGTAEAVHRLIPQAELECEHQAEQKQPNGVK